MKSKKIPAFIIGVAIALVALAAHPAASTQAIRALQPIIGLLLLDEEENVKTLKDYTIVRTGAAEVGEELNYSFVELTTQEVFSQLECELLSSPDDSTIEISETNGHIVFTPDLPGVYEILCIDKNGQISRDIRVVIKQRLVFNVENLENFDNAVPLSKQQGLIDNQVWVDSTTLNYQEIALVIDQYSEFSIVGDDDSQGVLVEFNQLNILAIEQIEMLKLQEGIDWVIPRFYEGGDIYNPSLGSVFPDEYSLLSSSERWHVDFINLPEAWGITTGSNDISIGVTELNFDLAHLDLRVSDSSDYAYVPEDFEDSEGRIFETDDDHIESLNHGNGSLSAISAKTNNGIGIAGINWVSPTCVSNNNIESINNLITICPDVRVFNMSWLTTGKYLETNFDQFNSGDLTDQYQMQQLRQPKYRKLAQKKYFDKGIDNSDILFVVAAGNGVGNGAPDNSSVTGFGVNARLENGGLHYDNRILDKISNIIVVGAIGEDSILKRYSDYGKSIDIVAPTEYLAAAKKDYKNYLEAPLTSRGYWKYGGTSAAAPVVTGVASLVFSVNPKFSGSDVKKILIDSAEHHTSLRFGYLDNAEPNDFGVHVPILNAEKAVKLAQDIVDGAKVTVGFETLNPAQAQVNATIKTAKAESVANDFSIVLERKNADNWEVVGSPIEVGGSSIVLPLSLGFSEYRISGTGKVTHQPTQIEKDSELLAAEFKVSTINLSSKNGINQQIVPNMNLKVEPWGASSSSSVYNLFTDTNGSKIIYLMPGTYKIHSSASGFDDAISILSVPQQSEGSLSKVILLSPFGAPMIGSLSGLVTNQNGGPIANAEMSIIGGGVTTSTNTDVNGRYHLTDIPKEVNSSYIYDFTLNVSSSGYASSTIENVIVLKSSDGETSENVILVESNVVEPPITNTPLNDTGITFGGDYPSGNNVTCTNNIPSGVSGSPFDPVDQDCSHGRDATYNDDSDGHAGFSFTKLDAGGNNLPSNAISWACVRDNVTGLVWEVKTDDNGIHDKDNTYRWGGKTVLGTGFGTYYPDWDSLVDGSNSVSFCGYENWRVPNREQLHSIVDYSQIEPSIDISYFPYTLPQYYWTASPGTSPSKPMLVSFLYGDVYGHVQEDSSYYAPVRLVRYD